MLRDTPTRAGAGDAVTRPPPRLSQPWRGYAVVCSAWNFLCHFPNGSAGIYRLADERLLIGSRTTIIGLEGLWIVAEMNFLMRPK